MPLGSGGDAASAAVDAGGVVPTASRSPSAEKADIASPIPVMAPLPEAPTPIDTVFDVDRDLAEGESWNRRERHPEPMEPPPPAVRPEPKVIPVPEPEHHDERPVFPERQTPVVPQPVAGAGEPAPDTQPRRRGWWQRVME